VHLKKKLFLIWYGEFAQLQKAVTFINQVEMVTLRVNVICDAARVGNAIRDPKSGLCIECQPDEPGEIVGGVRDDDRGGPKNFSVKNFSA
jgi:hypothetical protein